MRTENFVLRSSISKDEIVFKELKEVAKLLKTDYYDLLLHSEITFKEVNSVKGLKDISQTITEEISRYRNRKSNEEDEDTKKAIRLLTNWFDKNEEEGEKSFTSLYRMKEKLLVETIEDKANLYNVLTSSTSLENLARIAEAIQNDPEIFGLIENLIKETQNLGELKKIGEFFETILEEALKDFGFEVENVLKGKDLIITLKNSKEQFFIEVKSTKLNDFVSMTSAQGKEASNYPDNYALCVIYNDGSTPTTDYIKKNAKLTLNIGSQLEAKVKKAIELENSHSEISEAFDDIVLAFESGLDYRYQISHKIWSKGISFHDFITFLSSK